MTKGERIIHAINHIETIQVPVDFGATGQTGISASMVYKLREALGLEKGPIRIQESAQLLGELDEPLRRFLFTDVVGLWNHYDFFGNKREGELPFSLSDGTPIFLPETFRITKNEKNYFVHPQGDADAEPSAKMPIDGFFFDGIDRTSAYDENNLRPLDDWNDSFGLLGDDELAYLEKTSGRLYNDTEYAICGNLGGGGLGDVATIPGPSIKNPTGIRKLEDWITAHILHPDYIRQVFQLQSDIMLKNLERYRQAVQDRIQIIWISGTDFGTQHSEFYSKQVFRELYKPYYAKINNWVHTNTNWKTFFHSCGSVVNLIPDMIEMGVDILNPVQLSAAGMDAEDLKARYGDKLVFWGGGVDTQNTLPFGTPQDVKEQVKRRIEIFNKGGGFVFSAIHNIVAKIPVPNVLAMVDAIKEFRDI